MDKLYPLLMAPCFRHGAQTPWGGHNLRDIFMKDAPEDITGESLEVAALPGYESAVANGAHTGQSLTRVAELWGEALTGVSGSFPLLLKLLDAQEPLSVQVHPGDDYAREHENGPGRNMAWVILNAEPGAKIVYGLETGGEDLRKIMDEGRLEECLHWEAVRPGDVFYIPHGMVHALGEGIQCYEIQLSSEAAYRLWDWNRVGPDGSRRALHAEQALDVCRPELRLPRQEGATVLCRGGSRTYYISDGHIELCRLNLSGRMPLESGRMLALTPLSPCMLCWEGGELILDAFNTALVPAALDGAVLEGNTKVLLSCLSDREALAKELDYRAENVAGLVD